MIREKNKISLHIAKKFAEICLGPDTLIQIDPSFGSPQHFVTTQNLRPSYFLLNAARFFNYKITRIIAYSIWSFDSDKYNVLSSK